MPAHPTPHNSTGKKRLSAKQIEDAIRTVRVVNSGRQWAVKKVAHPKVWHYDTREEALDQAKRLAVGASYSVVIHDRNGHIIETLPPADVQRAARALVKRRAHVLKPRSQS